MHFGKCCIISNTQICYLVINHVGIAYVPLPTSANLLLRSDIPGVCPFSPPVRWGLLDFMWAVLLLFLLPLPLLLLVRVLLLCAIISSIFFASCMLQGADRSGQRRTSTGSSRLQWAAPDSSRLQWAAPGLTPGAPERSGQRRTSPGELPSEVGSARPHQPEDMSKEMSEICQTKMSEDMSEEMSEDMSTELSDNVSDKNVRKDVRRYVNRNVR